MNSKDLPHPPKLIQLFCTIFFGLAGLALLFCSLYLPPQGEIHPTVLGAYGMTLTFVGTAIGIDYNNRSKFYNAFAHLFPEKQEQKKQPKQSKQKGPTNQSKQQVQ